MVFDMLVRLRPIEPPDNRVVIIGITEQDLRALQTYPVTDAVLADVIQTVKQTKPAAIGVDIFRDFAVGPGKQQLDQVIRNTPNLRMIYRVGAGKDDQIPPPIITTPEQQGFADVPLDVDGNVRRSLLGLVADDETAHTSLATGLAMTLSPDLPGDLPMLTASFGAYHRADDGGDQLLLNPRQNRQPFRRFSIQAIRSRQFLPQDFTGKIVLIGVTAASIKDVVNAPMILSNRNGLVDGVEYQAHVVSQLISAVPNQRPLLRSWHDLQELLWVICAGAAGWGIGFIIGPLWRSLLAVILGLGAIVGVSYGLLLWGWWVPLLPAGMVFAINGLGFVVAKIYQQERDLRLRLQDRQMVLDQTFTAVHNGPLQDLAGLMRQIQDSDPQAWPRLDLADRIQQVNQELRGIFELVQVETLKELPEQYAVNQAALDLNKPLHELLQQVYEETCRRSLPGFATIQVKIVSFEVLEQASLTTTQKRAVCQFLEEALCNIGKHAQGATRLWVQCSQTSTKYEIIVKDNGVTHSPTKAAGSGTKQAKQTAKQLRGKFSRSRNQPQGIICKLVW
jgi:CHASE2 domain-containing sensor protein